MSDATRFLLPEGWAPARGYANGIVLPPGGRLVVLAGQIGWDPATGEFTTDDFAGQARQTLQNVAVLLGEAGGAPEHLVRLTWYVTSRAEYVAARREVGVAWRELFGACYPPMSVIVVSGLVEERARVEIEATAVLPA